MNDPGPYRPLTYFQLMEISLRELLVEKGVVTEEELAEEVEAMRKRGYERGARVVARAWVDRDYKQRLLEHGTKACLRPATWTRSTPRLGMRSRARSGCGGFRVCSPT